MTRLLTPLQAFWAAACHALIDELVLLRGTNPAEDVREWLGALGALEEAMKIFAPRCPIFGEGSILLLLVDELMLFTQSRSLR